MSSHPTNFFVRMKLICSKLLNYPSIGNSKNQLFFCLELKDKVWIISTPEHVLNTKMLFTPEFTNKLLFTINIVFFLM